MEPENTRFGGGSSATILHPIVAVAMLLAVVLILLLPRKYAVWPVFLTLFLFPQGQVIVLAGIHLNAYRIIILAGLARWMISRRTSPMVGGFNFMDRLCVPFFLCYYVTNSLLYHLQTQAIIKNTGDLLDALGCYIVIRFLIRDREDVERAIKVLAAVALVSAGSMLYEQRTGANPFALLGGMPAEVTRDGKVRSQAAFSVFITAGSYGAAMVPLLIWLWSQTKARMFSIVGILASTVMAVTCFASTTMAAYAAGVGALFLWPIRKYMRFVRWGIVLMLIALHMVMHGPVWSLVEHIDLTGSSSSYHRYMLIDNLVRHFGDWWFLGTRDNASWGFDMWDTSNEYVAYAFTGGLLGFTFFIWIISRGFARLGAARKLTEGNRSQEWFLWCLGGSMLTHVVSFFGIRYFDQMQFAWFALLAIISVAVYEVTSTVVPKVEEELAPSCGAHAAVQQDMQLAKQSNSAGR